MKYLIFLFLLPFTITEACKFKRIDPETRFVKAEFVFIGQSVSNNSNIKNIYEPYEVTVKHSEIIKGEGPPTKFTLIGCGFGSSIGDVSLYFLEKHQDKWVAYAIPESLIEEYYFDTLKAVKQMATNNTP